MVDEMMGYFGLEERACEPLEIFASMLIGIGFDIGRTQRSRSTKAIIQMDHNGKTVAVYFSLADAVKKTGIDKSNISRTCLEKRETAGGFKWRYLNPNDYYKNRRIK